MTDTPVAAASGFDRALAAVERVGNRLPDPAMLFLMLMLLVWGLSWWLSGVSFDVIDPRSGAPLQVKNLLTGTSLTGFMANMVQTFVSFHPLGVVLVAMLGIGVAEHTGFINAALRALLSITAKALLTPMLIAVAILSHLAVDAGYVLVIPLGGVIFYAAGRHPLAGIAAAFAGVSGGFSATFIPGSLEPLLQGLTQAGAQVLDPGVVLNPLNNYFFTTASSVLIIGLGWFLTDKVVEPRLLRSASVDADVSNLPTMAALTALERRGLRLAVLAMVIGIGALVLSTWPAGSAWRAGDGTLTTGTAPLMQSIVSLIFLLFLIPGVVYGYATGSVKSTHDVVRGMTHSMSLMGYYIVMAFFAAQFIAAFSQSNLGALIAVSGASGLKAAEIPVSLVLIGIIFLTAVIDLLVGSASAKWALLAPILVPMLMQLGISPDLTQAAYRIGDSSTNIITPLMPYFPLVVVFAQKYVKNSGIGTVTAMMLPYALGFLVAWTALLMLWWGLGIPLGIGASYAYVPTGG